MLIVAGRLGFHQTCYCAGQEYGRPGQSYPPRHLSYRA